MTIRKIRETIEIKPTRSAWDNGVKAYALELLDGLQEDIEHGWQDMDVLDSPELLKKALLNGAADWNHYSWGGSALIYNCDIAERLCTPSELKKARGGERRPNGREEWLDTQARALYQAARRIQVAARECAR